MLLILRILIAISYCLEHDSYLERLTIKSDVKPLHFFLLHQSSATPFPFHHFLHAERSDIFTLTYPELAIFLYD